MIIDSRQAFFLPFNSRFQSEHPQERKVLPLWKLGGVDWGKHCKNRERPKDLHDLHLNKSRHLEGNHMSIISHMAKQDNQKKLSGDYM